MMTQRSLMLLVMAYFKESKTALYCFPRAFTESDEGISTKDDLICVGVFFFSFFKKRLGLFVIYIDSSGKLG